MISALRERSSSESKQPTQSGRLFQKERTMAEMISVGDVIVTRKPHACGGEQWTVIRAGADVKMRCATCGRIVMLDREGFLRRRKAVLVPGDPVRE